MKKILLIAPPFYRLLGSHFNGLHLGIAYIAAVLKQYGHDAKVYNADYLDSSGYASLREIFENFPTYKTILSDLSHPIWIEIKDKISAFNPDIIGITMFTANYKAAKNIAKISKALDPGVRIIVGGPHPSLNCVEVLENKEFDFAIRGEGEFSFLELIEGKKAEDIKGLSYKNNGKIIHNEDRPYIANLDILPFPNRDSFLNGTGDMEIGFVLTGRGCPYSCSYCASPVIWQRRTRFRSVSNVLEELECLKNKYDLPLVHFVDDTFTLNKRRTKEICKQIINRNLSLKWVCEARVDTLDEELISLMAKAGCSKIKIGVESGSDRILKMVKKGFAKNKVKQTVKLIKKYQIPLSVYLMAGFPGETNEDLRQTIELATELDADYYSLSIFTPYYGTQIWKEMEESGKKFEKDHWEYFFHQSQEMIINDQLSPAIVKEFLALNERERI